MYSFMSPFLRSLKYHINVKSFDSVALYIIFADYIFYLLTVGMTSEEITQTYHLSQNSMDDFYIAETPICSSQNSQISTNTLTIDTNFDDGHNDARGIYFASNKFVRPTTACKKKQGSPLWSSAWYR